ncbi:MAG: helix-turn-helix domain-containing protein [Candidatus Pacearchaeota archaeon]
MKGTKLKQTCKIGVRKAIDHYNLVVREEHEDRLTVSELANRTNVSRYVLYNMEHGIGRSFVENIEAVAEYCCIPVEEICPVNYKQNN